MSRFTSAIGTGLRAIGSALAEMQMRSYEEMARDLQRQNRDCILLDPRNNPEHLDLLIAIDRYATDKANEAVEEAKRVL